MTYRTSSISFSSAFRTDVFLRVFRYQFDAI